jgi:phosphonate transport system permease protein
VAAGETHLSYGFMRLEINFRSSTILGLVGAGGIGQELMTNIKLDRTIRSASRCC